MEKIFNLEKMLLGELVKQTKSNEFSIVNFNSYNEKLGDLSFLLSSFLEEILRKKSLDWNTDRWFDDSLIFKYGNNNNTISIFGVMIWGTNKSTQQWVDPFYFEFQINKKLKFEKYALLFCDLDSPELTYNEFNSERNTWNLEKINWKYIINSK